MALDKTRLLEILGQIPYPGFTRDIVSAGVVRDLTLRDGDVRFGLVGIHGSSDALRQIASRAREVLGGLEGVRSVKIDIGEPGAGSGSLPMAGTPKSAAQAGAVSAELIPDVLRTVAVASGKGGVGKSTVAVNLAVGLAGLGLRVGLLDVDIYGPSIPLMLGMSGSRPRMDSAGQRLLPFERYGIRFMSLGFLVDPGSAVIWRGPMVMKAIEQLLRDVAWGALDVLVLDMPPGTGDAQLTVSQRIRLAGAVIVTTPQDVALADAIKAVAMFRKVDVPLLGLVENMSHFVCPGCGTRSEIFGHGGGKAEAERLGVPFLGEIPLDPSIRLSGDQGKPATEGTQAGAFEQLARTVFRALDVEPSDGKPRGWFDRVRQSLGGSQDRGH